MVASSHFVGLYRVVISNDYVETLDKDGCMFHRYNIAMHSYDGKTLIPVLPSKLLDELYYAQDLGYRIVFEYA